MPVRTGQLNHEDGSFDIALAAPSPDGHGLKVVSFPEGGGSYSIDNNVPEGKKGGEFSSE